MKASTSIMIAVFLCIAVFPVYADDCQESIQRYNKATREKRLIEKERLFKYALESACHKSEIKAKIHNNLADTYENLGRIREAENEYKKALELDPMLTTASFSLGDLFFKEENYPYAIEYYEKGLKNQADELAAVNLKKARQKLPLYQSKDQIVSKLMISRGIGMAPPEVNLYFEFNAAQLSPQSKRQLEALLGALTSDALSAYRFQLSGHTCEQGKETYNQSLSERRSEIVKEWLTQNGFPAGQLMAVGYGESRPIADNTTEEGRRLNRRVEIKTTGIDLFNQRAMNAGKGMSLFTQGQALYSKGKATKAVELFEKALSAFKEDNNQEGLRATTGTLALLYTELGDPENAARYGNACQLYQSGR